MALFASVVGLVVAAQATKWRDRAANQSWTFSWRLLSIFLVLGGISLIAAWAPDIVLIWGNGGVLTDMGVTHAPVTYALDIRIMGPLLILALVVLRWRTGLGLALYTSALLLCISVAVQPVAGTPFVWHIYAKMGLTALVTRVVSFIALGAWGLILGKELYREQQ